MLACAYARAPIGQHEEECMDVAIHIGIVFAVAFAVTYAMVPVSKKIAFKIGAVDYPSNRRVNKRAIPRCGGIALYAGFFAGCAVLAAGVHFFGWELLDFYTLANINYPLLFVGVSAMFALGLVDDARQLSAGKKFAGQVICALIVALSGVTIGCVRLFGSDFMYLGALDIPLTVLYLVVFVNVINLIDGLDGLAAGIVAISCVAFGFLVLSRGSMTLFVVCVALFAVCLAFLRFNFNPASVFMGDSGALFLGLLVGIISLTGVVRMQSAVVMLVPLTIAGVPVIDTTAAIVRRKHQHKSVGAPDMDHVHHQLLKAGLSHRATVLVLYAVTICMCAVALLLSMTNGDVRIFMTIGLVLAGLVLIWLLGIAAPVLRHHYENKGKTGPRKPQEPREYQKKIK